MSSSTTSPVFLNIVSSERAMSVEKQSPDEAFASLLKLYKTPRSSSQHLFIACNKELTNRQMLMIQSIIAMEEL